MPALGRRAPGHIPGLANHTLQSLRQSGVACDTMASRIRHRCVRIRVRDPVTITCNAMIWLNLDTRVVWRARGKCQLHLFGCHLKTKHRSYWYSSCVPNFLCCYVCHALFANAIRVVQHDNFELKLDIYTRAYRPLKAYTWSIKTQRVVITDNRIAVVICAPPGRGMCVCAKRYAGVQRFSQNLQLLICVHALKIQNILMRSMPSLRLTTSKNREKPAT